MKKRSAIWIVAAAIVIVCAFLFPYLLLRAEQHGLESYSDTFNTGVLSGELLSLPQKLELLTLEDGYTTQEDNSAELPYDQVFRQFRKEMDALLACGAIPNEVYEAFRYGLSIERFRMVAFGEENRTFRYYAVYTTDGMHACLDEESGKILSISIYSPDLAPEIAESMLDDSSTLWPCAEQLEAWSEYFGLAVRNLSAFDPWKEPEPNEPFHLASCVLYDETGGAGFAVTYSAELRVLFWNPIPLEETQAEDLTG